MKSGERAAVFALATFHATALVLVVVVVAFRGGGLGPALQGLNTLAGLTLFLALWATTYVATRNAVRGLDVAGPGPIDADALTRRALRWGALNGVMFLLALAAVIPGGYALTHPADVVAALRAPTALQSAGLVVGGLIVAGAFALVVGGVVGVVFSGIDLVLLGVAARLSRGAEDRRA